MIEGEAAELGLEVEPTGDARVDGALRELAGLAGLETAAHPAVFERVHAQLVEALSELRTGPDRAAGSGRSGPGTSGWLDS